MRFKKVMIISFLLIAVLTLSAVSASENVTDTINEASDETNLELDYPDETYDPDDNKWDINLEEDCFTYGLDNHLKVYTPTIDKDRVEFSIDDDNSYKFEYNSTDDSFNTDISNLDLGEHIFIASYRGDNIHPTKIFNRTISIDPNIVCEETYEFGTGEVSLTLPKNATGNLTMYIGDTNVYNTKVGTLYANIELINGIAKVPVSNFTVGRHYVLILYTGDDYDVRNKGGYFDVLPKISIAKQITYGEALPITFTGNEGSNGEILINYEGENHAEASAHFINGNGKITLNDLPVSQNFTVSIKLTDSKHNVRVINEYVIVKPILTSKDKTIYYYDGSQFSVKVTGKNGKIVAGEKVAIKIGSKTYHPVTDKNGIATVSVVNTAGKYDVTSTYKGFSTANKLTIKPILKLTTVKVKKSSKKLVLTAKLAKKIKGKKISFKFNGKTYSAKTDKKGVAKVTIKKSALNKLKVGKKVKYQATYVKETVKKTATVKK